MAAFAAVVSCGPEYHHDTHVGALPLKRRRMISRITYQNTEKLSFTQDKDMKMLHSLCDYSCFQSSFGNAYRTECFLLSNFFRHCILNGSQKFCLCFEQNTIYISITYTLYKCGSVSMVKYNFYVNVWQWLSCILRP